MDRGALKDVIKKTEPIISVILWCSVIFYFSSIPGLQSGFFSAIDLILRKSAHITEYAILTFLWFRVLINFSYNKKKAIASAFIFAFLYSISDEIHQIFVSNREGKAIDVIIDSIGIVTMAVILIRAKLRK